MFFMEKTMKMDDLGGNLPPFEWPKTARTSAELCFDQLWHGLLPPWSGAKYWIAAKQGRSFRSHVKKR
jgi:hypothetical protein